MGGVVRLRGVRHVHAAGSPWARVGLDGIDLELARGERLAVVGANGSGKSTLVSVVAGLVRPTEGEASLDGVPLVDSAGRIGVVFQHARLQLLRPTVTEELAELSGRGVSGAMAAARAVELSPELLGRAVDALSGGEQRLVALGGNLARGPDLLVLDEPLAGLDAAASQRLLGALSASPATCVLVTHDLAALGRWPQRVVRLDAGRVQPE